MNLDQTNLSYWDWQRRIADAFLTPRAAGEAFVLFVDDGELGRLWPPAPEAAASLGAAVSKQLDWGSSANLFESLASVNRRRVGDSVPLVLPLLAITVLAATRMRRDGKFGPNAYFIRLAETLRPEASGQYLDEIRDKLSQSFGVVARLWREFDLWLRKTGTFGTSTIQEHPRLRRIGFPLSQAILRHSDRMHLTEFFSALDISDRGVPADEALTMSLRMWSSRPRGLSEAFLFALDDVELHHLVISEVARLAHGWDGVVRNPGGKRRLDMRIVVDLEDFQTRWTAMLIPDVPEDALVMEDGRRLTISTPGWGTQYTITGAPAPAAWIGRQVRGAGNHCSVLVDIPEVFAARENADAGGWLAVDGIEPYEEHLLVVTPDLQVAVEQLLEEAADEGWSLVPQRPPRVLLPGRCIYRRVRLSDPTAFEQVVSSLPPGLVRALRPETPPRPRLVNGLKVATNLGGNHYLRGGEPDLLLPAGPEPRYVATAFDGRDQQPPFRATGFPIPLRRPAPLSAGRHELLADGDRLVFHIHDTVDTAGTERRAAAAGWAVSTHSANLTTEGPFDVAGGYVAGNSRESRLLRRVSNWRILSRDGRARELTAPPHSGWADTHGLPDSQYFDFLPSTDDVWLVEFRQGNARKPILLKWQEPTIGRLSDADLRTWAAVGAHAGSNRLLALYLKAARP